MPTARKALAVNLRRLRERAGISQSELGRRAGVSRELVSKAELGRLGVSIESADALARALGVTRGELMGDEPVRPRPEDLTLQLIRNALAPGRGIPARVVGTLPGGRRQWETSVERDERVLVLDAWFTGRDGAPIAARAVTDEYAGDGLHAGDLLVCETVERLATGERGIVRVGDAYVFGRWQWAPDGSGVVLDAAGNARRQAPVNGDWQVIGRYVTRYAEVDAL